MKSIFSKIKKINFNLILAVISAGGFLLAVFLAISQQVWFDEAYSIWITKGKNIAETISLTSVDAHPPFYYILLNLWGNIFAWDIFWLRVLSLIFFALSIFVAGRFTQKIFGKKVAAISALLLIFSPFLLRYAFEIRMYSLASLITISSTFVFYLMLKNPKNLKLTAFYAVLVALGMYTLYTLALAFFAHFLLAIFLQFRKKNFCVWRENWFWAYFSSVILWLPWLSSFLFQLKNSASSGIGDYIGFSQLKNMLDFLSIYRPEWEVPLFISCVIFMIFALISLFAFFEVFSKSAKKIPFGFKIILASAVLPFLITIFISQPFILKKPFFVERYMSQFVILLYLSFDILAALLFAKNRSKIKILPLLSLFVIFFVGVLSLRNTGNFNYQNFRISNAGENMQKIAKICQNRTIIMNDIYLFMELQIYNKDCDLRIFTENGDDFGGGYAPINTFEKRIKGDENLRAFDSFLVVMNKGKKPEFTKKHFHQKDLTEKPEFVNLDIFEFSN